jgi:hypothetical protein
MHLFIYLEKRACEPDRHLHETVEIIIRGGKRQMAICNAYRQVAWRARPSHINKSGGRRRKPNQTNVATLSLPPSPALSFITHTHTHSREDRDASPPPHPARARARSLPSVLPSSSTPVASVPSAARLPHLPFPPPPMPPARP